MRFMATFSDVVFVSEAGLEWAWGEVRERAGCVSVGNRCQKRERRFGHGRMRSQEGSRLGDPRVAFRVSAGVQPMYVNGEGVSNWGL